MVRLYHGGRVRARKKEQLRTSEDARSCKVIPLFCFSLDQSCGSRTRNSMLARVVSGV